MNAVNTKSIMIYIYDECSQYKIYYDLYLR